MTTVAIITDTHCGVRNNSPFFMEKQARFYRKVFWPIIDELGIQTIFHLGDYFDNVKSLSPLAIHEDRLSFVEPALSRNMNVHMIPGNHDVFHKHTNRVCSLQLMLGSLDGFHVWMAPTLIQIEDMMILMVPWITQDNRDACMQAIQEWKYDYCFGHFEVSGYKMYRGSRECQTGMNRSDFPDISKVRSGHFHEPNGIYLGAPVEYTWADHGCDRGFHVLDLDTLQFTFIRNPETIFREIVYSKDMDPDKVIDMDLTDKIVRLVSGDIKDPEHYEQIRQAIVNESPYELEIKAHHPSHLPVGPGDAGVDGPHESNIDMLRNRIHSGPDNYSGGLTLGIDEILKELEQSCG